MQEWYFCQTVEKVCISLELFIIDYSSEKHLEENTLPIVLLFFFFY